MSYRNYSRSLLLVSGSMVALFHFNLVSAQTAAAPAVPASAPPASTDSATSVTINGQRATVSDRIDRRVYDVKGDPDAQTGVIADVLAKLPSVQVSPTGVVSLRGDTHVFIMVDGKYPANGNAVAQALSAADVDRVEVITNPSAQFAPEGTAGIINIITKKKHAIGFRGALNARMNSLGQSNLAPSFSFSDGRWSVDGRLRYGHVPSINALQTQTTFPAPSDQGDHYNGSVDTYVGALSGTYKIGDHSAMTLQAQSYRNDNKNIDDGYYRSETLNFAKLSPFSDDTNQFDIEGTYEYQNDDSGTHVTLDGDHTRSVEHERIFEADSYGEELSASYGTSNLTRGTEDNLKADMEKHVSENGLLTAGLQWDRHQTELDRYFAGDTAVGAGDSLSGLSHTAWIDQAISSAYVTYQWTLGSWIILPGLRAEYELRNLRYLTSVYHVADLRWYPSFHLQRDLGNYKKLKVSYSRRVQRPELSNYDPGVTNINARGEYIGNPYVGPMDTDSFEIEYGYNHKETNYQASLFLRRNSNLLTELTSAAADGFLTTTPINAGSSHSAGGEVTLRAPIAGGWKYSANLNLSDNELNRIGEGKRDYYSYNGNAGLEYDTQQGDQYQANLVLAGRAYSIEGYTKPNYRIDLSYQHPLSKKLVLVASITDLTKSQSETVIISAPDLKSFSYRRPDDQSFRLGLSWKFGGKK